MSAFQPSLIGRMFQWQEPLVARQRPNARKLRGVVRPALKSHTIVSAFMAFADLLGLSLVLCGFVAIAARLSPGISRHDAALCVTVGLLSAIVTGARRGCYDFACVMRWRVSILKALPTLLVAITVVTIAVMSAGASALTGFVLASAALMVGAATLWAIRFAAAALVADGVSSGRLCYRTAIFGDETGRVATILARSPSPFVQVIGAYDTVDSAAEPRQSIDTLLVRARQERVDAIILAYPPEAAERMREVFAALGSSVADIFISADLDCRSALAGGHPLGALPLLPARPSALTDVDVAIKSAFDRMAGIVLLLLLSPLFVLAALAIKLDSPGAVLFRQPRVGYNNALFTMYKFRSMQHNVADLGARQQTSRGDVRVTRVGRVIRRLSIDELPQLFNVIAGQMSLVGPRPHAPGTNVGGYLLEHVTEAYPLRHRVLPGITGWAQINGSRGALSSPAQIAKRVTLDLYYIDHWSIWLDMKILVLTVVRELVSKRAY